MDRIEYRSVIKFLHLEGNSPAAIKERLDKVYGTSAPSYSTVKNWVAELKRGRTTICDEERSGRPKTATTQELVDLVHQIVMDDRRLKVLEIAEAAGISGERVFHILHEDLGMKKLCARWVPRLLTVDNKQNRVTASKECLQLLNHNKTEFFRRFITCDETWVHYYTPETKVQSKEWVGAEERAPKKPKTVPSAGKVMASVFWDENGILFVDYLEKGKTITGAYYASLLERLKKEVTAKRPGLAKKKILFHHDNAPAHTSMVVMAKMHELHFDLVPHPPYSPDLAPCDFFLFPVLKKHLAGQKFATNGEVIAAVDGFFGAKNNFFFLTVLGGLKNVGSSVLNCVEITLKNKQKVPP